MKRPWAELIEQVGTDVDTLVRVTGRSRIAVAAALRRQGYSTGAPGRPPVGTVRMVVWVPKTVRDALQAEGRPSELITAWAERRYKRKKPR